MKKVTVEEHWVRFERWAGRYRKACVDQVMDDDHGENEDPSAWLFGASVSELMTMAGGNGPPDFSEDIKRRLSEKIAFLRGYFVDVSFDGPDFIGKKSSFLTLQYPRRCNNALGFWFEQDIEGKPETGAYPGFQGFSCWRRPKTDPLLRVVPIQN